VQVYCAKCGEPLGIRFADGAPLEELPIKPPPALNDLDTRSAAFAAIQTVIVATTATARNEDLSDTGTAYQEGRLDGLRSALEILRRSSDPSAQSLKAPKVPRPSPHVSVRGVTVTASKDAPMKRTKLLDNGDELSSYALSVLEVLAAHPMLSRLQVATLARVSPRSSTFDASLRKLRELGLLEGASSELRATAQGESVAGGRQIPKKGRALFEAWALAVSSYEAKLLRAVRDANGVSMLDELAEACDVSRTSSTFDAAIRQLKALALIRGSGRHGFELAPELRG
jgi:hypothetical protein